MMKLILIASVLSTTTAAFAETSDFERGFQAATNLCVSTVVKCVLPSTQYGLGSSEGAGRTETLAKNAWLVKCMAGQTIAASSKENCEAVAKGLKCVEVSK